MFNYSRLRGRIVECFGTSSKFASTIKRSNSHVSKVLNGKSYLGQDEIDLWCEALKIEQDEIGGYFFAH